MISEEIAKRIKAAREAKGLEQKELADLIGTSEKNVRRWELGRVCPRAGSLRKLCKALSMDLSDIMEIGEEERKAGGKKPAGYTEEELRTMYRGSRDKGRKQISILCDLACVDEETMQRILFGDSEACLKAGDRPMSSNWKYLPGMYGFDYETARSKRKPV